MNVLVTGATGVIGRQAVPRLLEAGHDVAVARSDAGAGWLRAVGAKPVEVDLFDPARVRSADANANAVVHLATAIPHLVRMRRPGEWRTNDRLRAHATRNLVMPLSPPNSMAASTDPRLSDTLAATGGGVALTP